MQQATVEKSFCTTREAANLLGVSVGTVQLWVESGLLQAWKTAGGHRRVMRDSLDSLLHKRPLTAPSAIQPSVESRHLKVLVVEDDANLLRLYQANMAGWPMRPEVTLTDNAVSALLAMGRNCPDLLVADLQMPDMDGFSMLRVLREAPEFAKTTIVIVTGLDAAEIELRGGIPADIEILPKPIPFDRLRAIAAGIVNQWHLMLPPA
ncbi:response regulator [Rhodoferax sp.]|uniref:response regulator n=1 Tax=Rhodoferax sp. TaxID=50421 RepID=UPI0028412508|nr:response regulator [Rhodoferax sp.]MDR3368667.1 response regulator [Rhodoferax sp.]